MIVVNGDSHSKYVRLKGTYPASVQRVHHSSRRRKSGKSSRKNSVASACFVGLGAASRHTKKGRGGAASNTNSRDRFTRTSKETKDVTTMAQDDAMRVKNAKANERWHVEGRGKR